MVAERGTGVVNFMRQFKGMNSRLAGGTGGSLSVDVHHWRKKMGKTAEKKMENTLHLLKHGSMCTDL